MLLYQPSLTPAFLEGGDCYGHVHSAILSPEKNYQALFTCHCVSLVALASFKQDDLLSCVDNIL